jgi:hypothetical protein
MPNKLYFLLLFITLHNGRGEVGMETVSGTEDPGSSPGQCHHTIYICMYIHTQFILPKKVFLH